MKHYPIPRLWGAPPVPAGRALAGLGQPEACNDVLGAQQTQRAVAWNIANHARIGWNVKPGNYLGITGPGDPELARLIGCFQAEKGGIAVDGALGNETKPVVLEAIRGSIGAVESTWGTMWGSVLSIGAGQPAPPPGPGPGPVVPDDIPDELKPKPKQAGGGGLLLALLLAGGGYWLYKNQKKPRRRRR